MKKMILTLMVLGMFTAQSDASCGAKCRIVQFMLFPRCQCIDIDEKQISCTCTDKNGKGAVDNTINTDTVNNTCEHYKLNDDGNIICEKQKKNPRKK